MDTLIPDFGINDGVDFTTPPIPYEYPSTPGGDLYASGEPTLSFPQCSSILNCGEGTATQDGTTGDTTDTSHIWGTLAGIGGSFLKAFTGGTGTIRVGGSSTAPKPPTAAAAVDNSMLYVVLAAVAVLIVILATRK
jgi:hypothetical protein